MIRIAKVYFVVTAAIAVAGLLAMQALHKHDDEWRERQFSERVNLALRQTAHRLLAIAGDHSTAIPPVEQTEDNSWLVRLEHNFNYDSLPPVLQAAFALHRIEDDYNVAVLDCGSDNLMLGYTVTTLSADNEFPCAGREQTAGCYNLRISFPDRAAAPSRAKGIWVLLQFAGLILLAYSTYALFNFLNKKRLKQKLPAVEPIVSSETLFRQETPDSKMPLHFGQSTLHVGNQKLTSNGAEKDLTYRETKLLQLFCCHANELLERDLILKSVWEDEGIIVGRSVDVFVSRLRKLLKDDPTLNIVNVHGVGYRLEVRSI